MDDVNKYLIELGIEIKTPRMASKQTLRNNTPSSDPVNYYRKSIFIPYLDSLITSLNDRFAEDFEKFEVFSIHPKYMKSIKKEEFITKLKNIKSFYGDLVDNILEEGLNGYSNWNEKEIKDNTDLLELLDETFFPSIKNCILIAITLPSTTCSVERSFRYV